MRERNSCTWSVSQYYRYRQVTRTYCGPVEFESHFVTLLIISPNTGGMFTAECRKRVVNGKTEKVGLYVVQKLKFCKSKFRRRHVCYKERYVTFLFSGARKIFCLLHFVNLANSLTLPHPSSSGFMKCHTRMTLHRGSAWIVVHTVRSLLHRRS